VGSCMGGDSLSPLRPQPLVGIPPKGLTQTIPAAVLDDPLVHLRPSNLSSPNVEDNYYESSSLYSPNSSTFTSNTKYVSTTQLH